MSTRRSNVNVAKSKLGNRERHSPRRTKTPSANEVKNKFKFSPKGKRKLDFPFKGKKPGPLTGKLFYLDLNGSRYSNQLKKAIGQLGGTIEEFFRKEVTYLVTSRAECGKSPSSQSTPSPGVPSPITQTRSSSIKNYGTASAMSTDSPQVMDQVPSGTMRGKSIAQRSAGLKKGSTDILTIASTWGVNILHVDHLMNWVSQLMLKTKQQRMTKEKTSPSKRVSQTRLPKVSALRETYIKVEDLGFKYRPIFHEFKLWPEITFCGLNVCPFDPPRGRTSENSVTKRKIGERNVKKLPIHERPKHGYCECCEVRYNDLNMHLRGKQHKEFSKKSSNYTSLDKAIDEGLKIENLLKEVHLKKSSSLLNIDLTQEQSSLSTSCDDTGDSLDDDIFLLSSPRVPPRNRNKVSNPKLPSEENLNNDEKHEKMALVGDVVVGHGSIQETADVSVRSSPTTRKAKNTEPRPNTGAEEMENRKSRPVTRLQKASNLSSPCESKKIELASHKSPNKSKNTIDYLKQSNDYIGGNKGKSTEVGNMEELNNFENLESSTNGTLDNSNAVLGEMKNEDNISPRRSSRTRKSILNSPILGKKENESETKVHLSQKGENDGIEWKNRLRSQTVEEKNNGEQPLKEAKEKSLTSNQNSKFANKCKYSANTKDRKCEERNSGTKRRKRESINKIGDRNQTSVPVSEHNIIENRSNRERENNDMLKNTDNDKSSWKEADRRGRNEEEKLRENREIRCEVGDTDEEMQHSKDSPRLKTPSKKVSNNNFAMCPGALIYEESGTLRSARRRQSAVGDCKLSPITPCNLDGEYSVLSSCSEDIEFLPSGLRIYSSFGSSLGDVYKDINHSVDQIEDGDYENENVFDPKSDAPAGCSEIACSTEMQVSLTFMNVHAISAGCVGKDEGASATTATTKRKRILNEEEESITGRKCKRLSVASDGEQVAQEENGLTLEIGVSDSFRSSVAERVKLNRAICESLLQHDLLVSEGDSPVRPLVGPIGRKRKNVLQSSPFVEITNTGKKRKERAKSESRVRRSVCSVVKQNKNGRSKLLSACLTPNDPFSFDDY
ncbi:protein chiffon-like [Dendronephthya gigantea]|uniref:protein chiffon-like n=1 Tax=Dendronephthya gigantea TaxID=151771 RepID=UPI0010698722|nr:protein chiffon-like [Dendronephthya gigantea]